MQRFERLLSAVQHELFKVITLLGGRTPGPWPVARAPS